MAVTAYAALRSLLTTIAMEQTQSPLHPPFPFPAALIDPLLDRVRFMVDFLEQGWEGAEHLESRITQLAYAAEDAIETPIVDLICGESTGSCSENGFEQHYLGLQTIKEELGRIMAEMMLLIKDRRSRIIDDVHPEGSRSYTSSSSTANLQWGQTEMVGFEEDKIIIINKLTQQSSLRIIPIVGMGGIGKTTLARNVFDDEHIMMHFDVRVWVTVSQEYNVKDILEGVLSGKQDQRIRVEKDVNILGENVYRTLFGRRYLVNLDDMWTIQIWNEIKRYFPDNKNGSRIMVTTRLSNLAAELSTGWHAMKFLDEEKSWNLFCKKVFMQKSCPLELHHIGRKIVQICRGLPLAIVVIGGHLAKSSQTLRYWERAVEDFHTFLYLEDYEQCLNILLWSYKSLPIHLKPCLLYLGVFPEDYQIPVSELLPLWIAEGFLKPLESKTLEEIAEEYLKDLTERNFLMVSSYNRLGKIKNVMMHDILRELCLREAQKEMFYRHVELNSLEDPLGMHDIRRIVIRQPASGICNLSGSLGSNSHVRSLILPTKYRFDSLQLESSAMKFLRVVLSLSSHSSYFSQSGKKSPGFVNMRFLDVHSMTSTFLPRTRLWRNFQTLCCVRIRKPNEVWNLVQLRQLKYCRSESMPPYLFEDQHNHIVFKG